MERERAPGSLVHTAHMLGAKPVLAMWSLTPRSCTAQARARSPDEMQDIIIGDNNHNTYSLCPRPRCFLHLCCRTLESNWTALRSPAPAQLPNLAPGGGPTARTLCSGTAHGGRQGLRAGKGTPAAGKGALSPEASDPAEHRPALERR